MKFAILAALVSAFTSSTNALSTMKNSMSITHDTLTKAETVHFGAFSIARDKYFAAINSTTFELKGDSDIKGNLFVTNTGYSQISMLISGGRIRNSGVISFNSLSSWTIPLYEIKATDHFENSGNMYFGVYGSDLFVYSFNIFSEGKWINSGAMVFQGVIGRNVPVKIEGYDGTLPSITNSGKICLNNAVWRTHMAIEGTGCINVGPRSRLNFVFDKSQIKNRQTIVLDSGSELRISELNLASSVPYIKVFGLGESNGVTVDVRIEGDDKIDYSKDTGMLTLKKSGQDMIRLQIGQGYDENGFEVTYNYFGSTLQYKLAAPTSSHEICPCDWKFPDTPEVPEHELCETE